MPRLDYAQSRQRVWLEVHTDVSNLMSMCFIPAASSSRCEDASGGVAVAEKVDLAEPVIVSVETIEHDPFEEPFVEIRRRQGSDDRLVASIEVSARPTRLPGNPGREKYLAKQAEVLAGQAHLIEIDLLRGGTHASAVPRELATEKAGPFDYHICVHRFDRPDDFFVYPIRLEQRLPGIAIPLLTGDPDVPLPLQLSSTAPTTKARIAAYDPLWRGPDHPTARSRAARMGESPASGFGMIGSCAEVKLGSRSERLILGLIRLAAERERPQDQSAAADRARDRPRSRRCPVQAANRLACGRWRRTGSRSPARLPI